MLSQTGYYGNVPQRLPLSTVGSPYNASYLDKVDGLVNMDPESKQVYTVTVDTGTNGATYTVTVNGVTVSYLSASTNTTTIAAGIAAALNANSQVYGLFSSASASAVVTLTAQTYGTDIVVTSGALTTTVETVPPVDASPIYFGRGVLNLQTFSSNGMPLCSNVYASKLQAMVRTLTVAYTSGKAYQVVISVDGQSYEIYVVAATDLATLTTALVDGINGYMPANTVLAASSVAGTITLTAEVAGKAFTVGIGAQTTAANLSIADTTVGPLTDINRCFAGIALANYNNPGVTVGVTNNSYVANSVVGAMSRGQVVVYSTQTVATSDKVYLETQSGATEGMFFNTPSSTRLILTAASWIPRPSYDSSNLNVVSL